MTTSSAIPSVDYDRLRDSLAAAGSVVALAELHGGVCGALCAGGAQAAKRWLAECFEDEEIAATPAIAEELEGLIRSSETMLVGEELKFEPLLPDDEAPLEEQVQALALWCQGFLSGIGTTAPGVDAEGGSVAEILRDFAEISRAGLSAEEATGEGQPDFALAEIHEYVRVGVQLVFEELAAVPPSVAHDIH